MSDVEHASSESAAPDFTPAERAYFDTRGESALEAPAPATEKPAEQPAPQDAPEAKADPAPVNGQDKDRKVDYGALAEERGKRKALEAEVQATKVALARYEERLRMLAPQPQQPKPPPRPDEDIFGAVEHLMQQTGQTRQEIEAYKRQQAAEQQWSRLGQHTAAQEEAFKKDHPDYDDAWKHLVESRANEMRFLGATDQQIVAQLQNDARSLMVQALQAKKNPGELVYEFARARGYTKKEAKAAADAATDQVNERLDKIEAGQQASKSLSTVGGKAGGGEITATDILKMSSDEFEAFKSKSPAKYRRLMGAPS